MTVPVNIIRASSYENIDSSLKELLAPLGGIEEFVKPGMKVLIKPNFLVPSHPDTCTTTNPLLIAAVARAVLSAGGSVTIADSNALGSWADVLEVCGITQATKDLDVTILELKEARPYKIPQSLSPEKTDFKNITISGEALDADIIINLPKAKAHAQYSLTLATKNLYGCCVGKRKAYRHLTSNGQLPRFTRMILANAAALPVVLNIIDAIDAMERYGPRGGDPRNIGLLAASPEALALDAVFADVLNLGRENYAIIHYARALNLGNTYDKDISFPGLSIEEAKIPDFALPADISDIGFGFRQFAKSCLKTLRTKLGLSVSLGKTDLR